ncbi:MULTISPECIES: hypothetical protein [unclassified Rhodococcus (in: high G+C Gram-positive bacteria)]|uniref:hypothetical protein n=1 Tax=unclassified Rhodococcus (in: high G+C Gram-positive bacteria) TaxID=192944 RepID=UPI001C9ADD51|nr:MULTISPECIES: hypothetical protein [unclassified Rhodococcus (in: high G+C Gram-positive bacteria)]MBY6604988.1 hypothetical protein [Rhodococcus sp. BP-351]MBY6610007.1 hypothetical protein [Rhodococcus sp. BP-361]MBY6613663.1 hypothetical protein [Rhodococcus sp. BP-360]
MTTAGGSATAEVVAGTRDAVASTVTVSVDVSTVVVVPESLSLPHAVIVSAEIAVNASTAA